MVLLCVQRCVFNTVSAVWWVSAADSRLMSAFCCSLYFALGTLTWQQVYNRFVKLVCVMCAMRSAFVQLCSTLFKIHGVTTRNSSLMQRQAKNSPSE